MIHSRIRQEVVAEHLARYGQPAGGSFPEQVQRLATYFEVLSVGNRIRLSHCDLCNSYCDSALPACAFCGDEAPVDGVDHQPGTEIIVQPVADQAGSPLDRVLSELHVCAQTHWRNLYRTGRLLKRIRDEELWRQRVDQHGLSIYKGYLEFVAKEVGIQQAYATRLIRVVEQFSEADVARWGIQRLYVAARLPKPQRAGWLERTAGLSTDQLGAAASAPSNLGAFPRMTGKTIVTKVSLGRVLARLYAKTDRRAKVGEPQEDAVSLEQRPFTMVQLGDDLWVRIDIKRAPDGSGALVAGFSLRQGATERATD